MARSGSQTLPTQTKADLNAMLCKHWWKIIFFMGILSLTVSPCSAGAAEGDDGGIVYQVDFEGVVDDRMERDLRLLSTTVTRKDQPPPTLGLLRARVERDIPELVLALRSLGYYGAAIEGEILDELDPVRVTFRVQPGNVYTIRSVTIEKPEDDLELQQHVPSPLDLGLTPGMPADARKILDAEGALAAKMKTRGYPFARVQNTRVVVDHRTEDVSVTFPLVPGPPATFGHTEIEGLTSVAQDHVLVRIPWQKGERYNEDLLQEYRERIADMRLFTLIRISRAQTLDEDGSLPITIELTERKPRTVRAGVSYRTDEGFGATASWEHRNLRGYGERLRTSVVVSEISQSLEGAFDKPDFLRLDQSLGSLVRIAQDETDAYKSQNLETFVLLNRKVARGLNVSAGPGFRLSKVDDKSVGSRTREFALLSFPAQMDWDFSDDLLDPTRGGRMKIQLTPYMDTLDTDISFLKSYISYSHYLPLLQSPSLLLAGRAALGSIAGTSRDNMPSDIRFYAGGGGSIRGYPFQSVSPLDGENVPEGGRSLIEFSAELRWKVTETLGLVTFLDGGGAFEPSYPDFSTSLRYGAGGGVRYFTPIGPLRLDVGVPLNRRPGIDSAVQFYLSLGQAF